MTTTTKGAAAGSGGGDDSAPSTTTTPSVLATPSEVTVHPLVLLSVVDHHHRVARDTRKRVVGILLGEVASGGKVDVTNSFAVPFEEDERDPSIWFLDHSYAEAMLGMFRKVNARERVVGWYSTGPRLRPNDLAIHALLGRFCSRPVLVVCRSGTAAAATATTTTTGGSGEGGGDDQSDGLPITAYAAVDDVREGGGGGGGSGGGSKAAASASATKVFANVPTSVAATEAEDVGVEHLLRDVADDAAAGLRTLSGDVSALASGLSSLRARLSAAAEYADAVAAGKLPANHDVLRLLQDAFNALPTSPPASSSSSSAASSSSGGGGGGGNGEGAAALAKALSARSNDMMLAAYVGSLVRAVLALHGLVDNRETSAARRREAAKKEREKEEEKKKKEEEEEEKKKKKKKEGGEEVAAGKGDGSKATADGKKK